MHRIYYVRTLSQEEQLSVLRQDPDLIVHDELQLVDVAADLLDHRCHVVVVGDGSIPLALDLVGLLPLVRHLLHLLVDACGVLSDLLDERHVVRIQLAGFVGWEYL